jgi:hypothetical protein
VCRGKSWQHPSDVDSLHSQGICYVVNILYIAEVSELDEHNCKVTVLAEIWRAACPTYYGKTRLRRAKMRKMIPHKLRVPITQ